ncbi:MAG: formylmethanofuran dehydrogenase subunit E family protein [Flavobacteriales bacterium]|nr:formylmethanofuran dehydrogenase subunit E family protein [Flavobacteriales bacterium]
MKQLIFLSLLFTLGCEPFMEEKKQITFETIDTDFSKGRLNHNQTHSLTDLEKFHGHLCDGLVVGALAIEQGMKMLYPDGPIDRTNLRIVSQPSPCSISLNEGVKPAEIDSLGSLATQQKLSACQIDELKLMEDDFTDFLLRSNPEKLFTVSEINDFVWNPNPKNDYLKSDILNKNAPDCK